MNVDVCPDRETLVQLLLGKLSAADRETLGEHLSNCSECMARAESVTANDEVIEAIRNRRLFEGDEDILAQAIERGKQLRSERETVESVEATINVDRREEARERTDLDGDETFLREMIDSLHPAIQPDELGRLGDYRVLEVLGVGGMGVVFRAEDPRLQRQIALKAMRPGVAASKLAKDRFLREARAAAAMDHENIVQIFQVGEDGNVPFIAMQLMRGESLRTWLAREGKLDPREVARIGREVSAGLAAAHRRGMIHRDIKPDNIWIDGETGRAKLLDFGLVRTTTDDAGLTQSGMVLGTPRYMAPEQALGDEVDARCDLFSLGSVLYHLATGKAPFAGGNVTATLLAVVHDDPVGLNDLCSDLDAELAGLIMRLLQKDPAQRPQTAAEVAEQLAAIEQRLEAQSASDRANASPDASSPSAMPAARSRRLPVFVGGTAVAAALALFFVLWAAGIIFKVRTEHGTILVEIDGSNLPVEIDVSQDKTLSITDPNDGSTIRVTVDRDKRQLRLDKQGFLLAVSEFSLKSPDGRRIQVSFEPRDTMSASSPSSDVPDTAGAERQLGLVATLGERGPEHGHRIAFHPGSKTLASNNRDQAIKLWDIATGQERETQIDYGGVSSFIAYSGDGRILATAGTASAGRLAKVKLCDAQTLHELLTFDVEGEEVLTALAISPNGQLCATAHRRHIKIWNSENGRELFDVQAGSIGIGCLVFSPDGKTLASSGSASQVKLWDTTTGEERLTINGEGAFIFSVAFSPDGKTLATGSVQNTIVSLRDVETGQSRLTLKVDKHDARSLAFSPDGMMLACGGWMGHVYLWDVKSGRQLRFWQLSDGIVHQVAFDPNGSYLAAANSQGTISLMRLPDSPQDASGENPSRGVADADLWAVDHDPQAADLADNPAAQTPAPSDKDALQNAVAYLGNRDSRDTPHHIAFSLDGGMIVSNNQGSPARVWDIATAREWLMEDGHEGATRFVAFAPDGTTMASAGWRNTIKLWDPKTGKELNSLQPEGAESLSALVFAPEGRTFATAHEGKIRIWDTELIQEQLAIDAGSSVIQCLAFNPDGKTLASSGMSDTVKLWDAGTGEERPFAAKHADWIYAVAFSPDGKTLATGSADKTVVLRDAATGEAIRTLSGHEDVVRTVAFSNDGSLLASGGTNGTVSLWDVKTGQRCRSWQLAAGMVHQVAFDPSGPYLAAANGYGTIVVLNVSGLSGTAIDEGTKWNVMNIDRRAAAYVLSLGGRLKVSTSTRWLDALPDEQFHTTMASFEFRQGVTDDGLAIFRDCQHLQYLNLRWNQSTDAALAHFKNCRHLESLLLGPTTGDEALAILPAFAELKNLHLTARSDQVTSAGLRQLRACRQLTDVTLIWSAITDESAAEVKNWDQVTHLRLQEVKAMTDRGLAHLKDCKQLRFLELHPATCFSGQAIDELKAALPHCEFLIR